ncbi:PaaI family thioesterase [Actinomycetospora chiangmaiensis]|uniref:PaaI family thioesterase n=1 Tax=Actinomycetospora chiangmaiensis TaxID=402650 RepID=UPI0005240381|nr:PaaI family thioesterase [Actinomycetospora chiangmaiensis]
MTTTPSLSSFRPATFADLAPAPGAAPDYDHIRATAEAMVPFNSFVGLRIAEVRPDGAVVENPVSESLHNQMGTVHAGVLFLLGDVAGAAAFCGQLAPLLAGVERLVLRDARTQFLKPALGRIRAHAHVDDRVVADVLAGRTRGRFDLDGRATLTDDAGVVVARMSLDYVCVVN